MALRNLRIEGDEILNKVSRPVTEMKDRYQELIDDMLETMYESDGVGLAAVQVGVLRRIVVIDVGEGPVILINPEIVEADGEQTGSEGCLSVPGKAGIVTRPNHVKAKALDRDMKELTEVIESEKFKAVVVDMPLQSDNISNIGVDHAQAQKDILRKTITENTGPSDSVLYISGRMNSYVTEERIRGARELSEELGFDLTVKNGAFSEKNARELTMKFGRDKDIIACGSDLMAIGAMKALTDMNVFHPVCGFDGITLMGYAGKNMVTVRQDFKEIGEEALRECCRLMGGEKGRSIRMPYSLMQVRYEDVLV